MPRFRHRARLALLIALVGDGSARFDVRTQIKQHREARAVAPLAAGQVKGDGMAVFVGFQVDFGGEPAARAPERLILLPPFAPAAETWARTTVESNIWIKCAVELNPAKVCLTSGLMRQIG